MEGENDAKDGVKVSNLMSVKSLSPSLARRIQQRDVDGDGMISLQEAVQAILGEQDAHKDLQTLRLLALGLLMMIIVVLATTGGAIYGLVELNKKVGAQDGILVASSTGQPLSVGSLKMSVPLDSFDEDLGTWAVDMEQIWLEYGRNNTISLDVGTVLVSPSNQSITIETVAGYTFLATSDEFQVIEEPEWSTLRLAELGDLKAFGITQFSNQTAI